MLVNMVGLYTGSLYWGRGLYSEVYDILLSNVSYLNHTIQDNICPPPPTFICSIIHTLPESTDLMKWKHDLKCKYVIRKQTRKQFNIVLIYCNKLVYFP